MSTAFSITFPRRLALTAGLKLVQWARRPASAVEGRRPVAARRREAQIRRHAREERLQAQREHDVARYLSLARPMI